MLYLDFLLIKVVDITQELKFKDSEVNKVIDDFKKIKMEPFQKELVQNIAMLLKQFIPLPKMAIKGSMWFTIKEWQVQHEKTLSELDTMPYQEMKKAVTELIKLGRDKIKKMLANPEEQENLLNDTFDKVIKVAEEGIKQRFKDK